jgi:hypothetical protein
MIILLLEAELSVGPPADSLPVSPVSAAACLFFFQLGTAVRHRPPPVQVPGRVASSPYEAAPPIAGSRSFVPVPSIAGRHLEAFRGPPPLSPCTRIGCSATIGSGVSPPRCCSFPAEPLLHTRALLTSVAYFPMQFFEDPVSPIIDAVVRLHPRCSEKTDCRFKSTDFESE